MTLEELISAWRKWGSDGGGHMVRIRKSVLKNINLPEETKQFLHQAGLPEMISYSFIKPALPRLTELVYETGPLPASFARYRVFLEEGYCMFLCLDEEDHGKVVAVIANPDREKEVFFFHSSILHFAECCIVASEIWDKEIEQSDDEYKVAFNRYIARYEQAIREIDPPALAEQRTWCVRKLNNLKADVF